MNPPKRTVGTTAAAAAVATASLPAPPLDPHHPSLLEIQEGVRAIRHHAHRWSDLRRDCFPGESGWKSLQEWCAANGIECAIAYSQSSSKAMVHFQRAGAGAAKSGALT